MAGDSIVLENMNSLVANHVNWISQTPFGWQRGHDNPVLDFDPVNVWWGERDAGLLHTAVLAHSLGIKVILKPHIWIMDANGKWRSDIAMNSPEEWDLWFSNYRKFILHYAQVAEKGQMEALCIGTELHIAATRFPDRWRSMIREIRGVYSGKLTYAANFYKEFDEISFWDALDAIGVQGYFPLSTEKEPDLEALRNAWKPHVDALEHVHQHYGKPVIFTEIGYRNTADAAIDPWTWPGQLNERLPSDETQSRCLQAMFESIWDKEWFHGVFIWKWFHSGWRYAGEHDLKAREENVKRRIKEGRMKPGPFITFSPQGKSGEQVIRNWFGLE